MSLLKKLVLAGAATALMCGSALGDGHAKMQGVTDTEILIGSNNDLSGPFAAFGAPATQAAQMYFDEVNAAGGVHGRKIRFIVEDHGYQMPKAIAGMNKLINGDKVFAMLLSLGTPMNIAAFKLQDAKNVANISPLSAARQMNEPFSPLHYAGTAAYYEQIRLAVPYLAKEKGLSKVCAMYLPTDFGKEIQQGATTAAKENDGIDFVSETTHKPDDAEFVGALHTPKGAGCQNITLALGVSMTSYALISRELALLSAMGLVPVFLGLWFGRRMRHRISEEGFRRLFFLALAVSGVYMVFRNWEAAVEFAEVLP